MTPHRSPAVFSAAVLIAGVLLSGTPPHVATAAQSWSPHPDRSITLITGDRVQLGGPRGLTVVPAPGREAMGFRQSTDEHGDTHLVPSDAAAPVASGWLDPRLFNISLLAATGYDDATRRDIPLIVARSNARPTAATAVRELPSIDAIAVRVAKSSAFWSARSATSTTRIWLDGPMSPHLDRSAAQIGAPSAWRAGHTGKGATVAVLDTGVDTTHPDLAGAVVRERDFTGSASGPTDRYGHGTHVASIIAGRHDRYTGVAPGAALLNGKVLPDSGFGLESAIIAGMEWAVAEGADVVNMSLGNATASDGADPVSRAVNRLTERTGTLFVVAAGNTGDLVGSPAAADAALTVGAVDERDALADFSSRGPRLADDGIKPDITAPGVDVVAARASGSSLGQPVGDRHTRVSGTSMAAPHVAGAAAILAARYPHWRAEDVKAALTGSAKADPALSVFEQGAGRVDLARAVSHVVHATPAAIGNGLVRWPHTDDEPVDRVVTYHNAGTKPVTLAVEADVRAQDGTPAPAGMFTVAPREITVPAGGRAEVTVTTDTAVDGVDGLYSGTVTATGGDSTIRTPLAVTREVESYDVRLTFLGADGLPTPDYDYRFIGIDHQKSYQSYDESGTVVVRLPKGHFHLQAHTRTGPAESVRVEPAFVVEQDTALTVDHREGKPLGFAVDRPEARSSGASAEFSLRAEWGEARLLLHLHGFNGYLVTPSSTSAPGKFTFTAEATMARPGGSGGFTTSPYLYHLRRVEDGRVPADLLRTVRDDELAVVSAVHATTLPGRVGERDGDVVRPLPFTLEELYTPDQPWHGEFAQVPRAHHRPWDGHQGTAAPRVFRRGQSVVERWNHGVQGPAFPPSTRGLATRSGDRMAFDIPLYSDSTPNHIGYGPHSGTTELYRGQERVGEARSQAGTGQFAVPGGSATYRLHVDALRADTAEVSTRVTADWTFRSGTTVGQTPLPLLAVRFAPGLDDWNQAPRDAPTVLDLTVDHNGGARSARPTRVEVSYDDGASWQPVQLRRHDDRWTAELAHPPNAAHVSLRAGAADDEGNSVDQTIIRAFTLK
ncbi:S8 family peptidase [Saccharothrix coeruleofusca]|uniref:Serine protease n=1 Tax=Saccharothrix coeruleofusca TaxID=33919 RepID=A0A918ASQ4_9PSEU|nr:S8 family serine peptidase [Saccharothrix coeruleofusca]GGP78589.1 serine protease [Saccharothrix coeruleofusca]